MKVYVLYDKIAEEFGPVFQQNTDEACKRALMANDNVVSHAEDYAICNLGELSNQECIFIPANFYAWNLEDFLGLKKE